MSTGEPRPRIDGPIKVTGAARFTADLRAPNMLHGVFVTAPIPAGKVIAFDKGDALVEPGVVHVLTHEDTPRSKAAIAGPPFAHSFLPLQDDENPPSRPTDRDGSRRNARGRKRARERSTSAMRRRRPRRPWLWCGQNWTEWRSRRRTPATSSLSPSSPRETRTRTSHSPRSGSSRLFTAVAPSQSDGAFRGPCDVGGRLTLYASTQHVYAVQMGLAAFFAIPPPRVRVISKHTGGAFGVKGLIWPQEALAALAAKIVGRPVRIVLSRADMYSFLGYQRST
jgi:xanthine dehydrogenase YagR molybdenum-binding subunit